MFPSMQNRNYKRVVLILGYALFVGALALPFLMPPGRVNGLALASIGLLVAAALCIAPPTTTPKD